MKTYCKDIDITDPEQIEPFIALCFAGKTGRRNFQRLAMRYSDLTQGQIDEAVRKHDNGAFAPAIKGVAAEIAARIRRRSLDLLPIRYYERADESNGKIRLIGVESTLQQCMDYVAAWALMPLFRAKIGRYQCASIPGRGQVDGKRAIERFIRRKDPHGPKSKYFVKMDVRHCYQNLTRRAVMRRLRRDVHKNPVLLWFVDALLSTFQHGFSIGSFLSQFLCNYMLSYAYHFATEQLYKMRKRRTGRAARVRLVGFVLFYMDDILFIGAAFKDVKKAARLFCAYLRDELGLEIKPIWHVKALAKEPIDIMGFVIRRDRTTVRARIFVRARRQFLRAWAYLEAGGYITIKAARRIISYRGYFSHTDSVEISAKLHIVEVSRAASNVISAAARAELAAAA